MQVFSPLSDQLFVPSSDFEREVLAFCKLWKSGQTSFLFHTSGSTGTPKPIWVSRDAMEASALSTDDWLQLKPNDVVLACLPVQYIAGAMLLVRALVLDLKVCLISPTVNPLEGLTPISIQLASFVPNQWHAILESGIDLSVFFSGTKGILLGGAALSDALKTRSMAYPFPIYETYGMTETVSHIAYRTISDLFFRTLGKVEIGLDERKCLKIKGLMTGNSWVQTNDIASIEDESRFEIKGRYDRVINSEGRKITFEGIEFLWLGGTNYLNIGSHPSFQKALKEGIEHYSQNFGSSRRNNLQFSIGEDFECALAAYFQVEAAAFCSSGLAAAQIAVQFAQ